MANLFVANTTRQEQRVFYRLDFNAEGQNNPGLKASFKFTDIPRGQQRAVGGDLHPLQVQEIVDQLRVYGALDVKDVSRQSAVVAYLYSTERAVKPEEILSVHQFNQGAQIAEGRKRREAAAIAANQLLMNTTEEEPNSFAVEVEQLEVSEADEKSIVEGYHVVTDPAAVRTKRPYNRRPRV